MEESGIFERLMRNFMDTQMFEETELSYLRQSVLQHGYSSFGRANVPNVKVMVVGYDFCHIKG